MSEPEPIPKGQMFLVPPAPDVCQECAVGHEPQEPHNAQSLFYQTKFNMEHGRAAKWHDALAHCSDEVRAAWEIELIARGVPEEDVLKPREPDA